MYSGCTAPSWPPSSPGPLREPPAQSRWPVSRCPLCHILAWGIKQDFKQHPSEYFYYLYVSVASTPSTLILMVTALSVTARVCSNTRPVTLCLLTRLKMPGPTLVTRHLSLIFHSERKRYFNEANCHCQRLPFINVGFI